MAPNAKPGLPKLNIPGQENETEPTKKALDALPSEPANTVDNSKNEDPPPVLPTFKEKLFSWRWRISIIVNLGNFVTMNMRGSMAMAMVCMAGAGGLTNTSYLPSIDSNMSFPNQSISYTYVEREFEFDWDRSTRGTILSATMYCGFFAPFLGGLLSQKFGARVFVSISMAAAGITCLLIPELTRAHVYALILMRFCLGTFTVGNVAAFQDIWSQWAPQLERVSLVSFSISGVNIANMFSSLVSGFLCTIPIDNGWPFVFYLFGAMCLLWVVLWASFVYNSPEEHPFISDEEKKYIMENRTGVGSKKQQNTPWMTILTSRAVWAYVLVQTANMWCAVTLFLYLPVYLNSILGFSIDLTGILLSIPFMCRFFGSLFWGYISDVLLRKSSLNVTKIRKLVQTIGFSVAAIASGCITFVPEEHREIAIVLIGVLLFFQSVSMASSAIIPLDIAPRYAGIITGGFIVVGSVLGILAPMVTSILIYGGTREVEWRIVFFILAGFYITGMMIFNIMGTAELQPWANFASTANIDDVEKDRKDGGCDDDGLDNRAFEIETPAPGSMGKSNGVNGHIRPVWDTHRLRTISNSSSRPRTPEVLVAIVQASEMGTPELVMKFPDIRRLPKSPLSVSDDKPSYFQHVKQEDDDSSTSGNESPILDMKTAVRPLDDDDDIHQPSYNTRL